MTTTKRQRGRPRVVSDGMIHEAIQTAKNVAEASRMLGLSHGHIYLWCQRLGCPGKSPAQRIKQRRSQTEKAAS